MNLTDLERSVINLSATLTNVKPDRLFLKTRMREIAFPRQLAIYILRKKGYTTHAAAKLFGKDHATAMHATKTIENLLTTKNPYQQKLKEIMTKLHVISPQVDLAERRPDYMKIHFDLHKYKTEQIKAVRKYFEKIKGVKIVTAQTTTNPDNSHAYDWILFQFDPEADINDIERIISEVHSERLVSYAEFLYKG